MSLYYTEIIYIDCISLLSRKEMLYKRKFEINCIIVRNISKNNLSCLENCETQMKNGFDP